jgi:hypothetical protein
VKLSFKNKSTAITTMISFTGEEKHSDARVDSHDAESSYDDDGSSKWSETSESEGASTSKDRWEQEMQTSVGRKEERIIAIVRILIFIAIICAATAVSVAVYFFATASDTAIFELQVSLDTVTPHQR